MHARTDLHGTEPASSSKSVRGEFERGDPFRNFQQIQRVYALPSRAFMDVGIIKSGEQ
jgi:hypothetical protein